MTDPVDRVIVDRARMDAGFPGGLLISMVAHFVLVGVALAGPLLFPSRPRIAVAGGFAVPLPRGGGGPLTPPAPGPEPKAEAPAPAVEPPKVLKPPSDEPKPSSKAVPELDARKRGKRARPEPSRAPASRPEAESTAASSTAPGLMLGPPGPGVPTGTDSGGDWYLAGVQQKIWLLWNQQVKAGFTRPVTVNFTILADGSVTEVQVVQSSGASLLDLAAQRAIHSASPFAPLPRIYGTNRKTIQAIFKPVS